MATKLKPIGHEDRLSLVEHLDELRTRIIICVVVFVVVGGVCLWQDDFLLNTINRPLAETTFKKPCDTTRDPLEQSTCWQQAMRRTTVDLAAAARSLAASAKGDPVLRDRAAALARTAEQATKATPRASPKRPVTLGVGEPFTATLTVAVYAALLISLPLLLYELYAFVLPAFSPTERQVALPLMLMVPFLFYAGVAFGYYVVLPAAVNFLQNFNDNNFDVLLRARDYYKFSIMTLLALGLCFQVPIGMMALGRAGIVTRRFLIRNWRYAIVIIAILAALLPGVDPVTTLLEMVPLIVLYAVSILLVPAATESDLGADDDL
jgi:sec-independent protein translocase protein TatC